VTTPSRNSAAVTTVDELLDYLATHVWLDGWAPAWLLVGVVLGWIARHEYNEWVKGHHHNGQPHRH
jgi:hypothetical protein